MTNVATWCAVEQNPYSCCGEENRHPIDPMLQKSHVPKDIKEKGPANHVECFCYVDFQKNCRQLTDVERFGRKLDGSEVVMQAPAFDECAQIGHHKGSHVWHQT
jgi:hypothetical protein